MKNLTIVINGLEYVAKNKENSIDIKGLEARIEWLKAYLDEKDSIINELRSTLDDIEHVLSRTH